MSVRRLAEASVQPAKFAFSRANTAWAKKTIKKYPKGREQSAVIPLLMRAQEQEGWVTKAAVEHVSDMLDMPLIRVLEVATFYTQFQLKPVGTKAHIQVCGTTPCMLRGSEDLIKVCKRKISENQFETNEAGTLSWEEVECLGACVNAPMVMVFKDTFEDLTPERLEEIIDAFEAGKGGSVKPGPQNGRMVSAPASGLTSLESEVRPPKGKSRKPATAPTGSGARPANAARPKTKTTPEANPAIKSPGSAKHVGKGKARTSAGGAKSSTIKLAETAKTVKPRLSRKAAVSGGNSTMKLAATASGRAARAPSTATPSDKNRPAAIKKPTKPDDLKLISGVGPKLEGVLHGLGIFAFEQVASWKKAERDWVDNYLKFKGRIERDDWVKQAKALAKGGEAEYIRVFGKKPR